MKNRRGVQKLLRLADVLMNGDGNQRDEYNSRQVEKGAYRMALVLIVLGAVVAAVYLSFPDINRTQLVGMAFTLLTLFLVGRTYVGCVQGTLTVSDRHGGRTVFLQGLVAAFLHGSLVFPTRYHFGGNLFFVDMGIAGVLLYYLAGNGAWRNWEWYQEMLDKMADQEQTEDARHVKTRWTIKNAAMGLLLAVMILLPAVLGFLVYDSEILEQAKQNVEAELEARKTPEYLEYEAFQKQWQEPETYVMVYQTPLRPQFSGDEAGNSYERAGALYIRMKDQDMTILFHPEENGVNILQANYQDYTQENPMRAEHLYVDGVWYRQEDWMQKQNEPGFAVHEVNNYHVTEGRISFPGVKALGTITDSMEGDNRRLTFRFSEEYLDDMDDTWKRIGMYSGESISEQQSLLIDPNGTVIEQQICSVQMEEETVNLMVHKEEVTDWRISRYLTTDEAEVTAMFQRFVEQGPEVPEEALKLYQEMELR